MLNIIIDELSNILNFQLYIYYNTNYKNNFLVSQMIDQQDILLWLVLYIFYIIRKELNDVEIIASIVYKVNNFL